MEDALERSGRPDPPWPGSSTGTSSASEREDLIAETYGPAGAGSRQPARLPHDPGRPPACAAEAERLAELVEVARARRLSGRT